LKLPSSQLSKLADAQRKEALKKRIGDSAAPLFKEIRKLILRKCAPAEKRQIRAVFEKQPFGELERLVTQRLLDVVKQLAKEELEDEDWLRRATRAAARSYEQMCVIILEFLETDVFNLSPQLTTFRMDIVLNPRLASGHRKRFEFVETDPDQPLVEEAGLEEFCREPSLSGDASDDEIAFLRKLKFRGKRPTALYYYRALQNLRDPLHFRAT